MTALRAHQRGGPQELVLESAPVPVPGAGEVLVAVHAAAITFDELTWQETWTRAGVSRAPVIPSHEVSGVIAEVGSGVTGFVPGDEVYGLIGFDRDGAAADFVAVPAADLAAKPSTVSHVVAAALPLAGLTALQALVDNAAVRAGESVLVLGGAGGVGALTVQLAALHGARVTATVRSDVGELLRGFGAQRVIDVRTEAFDGNGAAYDVVIDTVGGPSRWIRCHGILLRCHPQPRPADRARRARPQRPTAHRNRGDLSPRQWPGSVRGGRWPGRRVGKTVIVVRN